MRLCKILLYFVKFRFNFGKSHFRSFCFFVNSLIMKCNCKFQNNINKMNNLVHLGHRFLNGGAWKPKRIMGGSKGSTEQKKEPKQGVHVKTLNFKHSSLRNEKAEKKIHISSRYSCQSCEKCSSSAAAVLPCRCPWKSSNKCL